MVYYKIITTTVRGAIITSPFMFPKLKAVALAGTARRIFKKVKHNKNGAVIEKTKYEVILATEEDNLIKWGGLYQKMFPESIKRMIEKKENKQ